VVQLNTIRPNVPKALMLAKKQLTELVYDAVNLEGIAYTIVEVQTLLDGVTVGGHKISDQTITLNQAAAWHFLFEAVSKNQFSLTKAWALSLHAIAAKEELLIWGQFRTGQVTIAGTSFMPPKSDTLESHWHTMEEDCRQESDVWKKAILVFLTMARYQFFYDVNKRMGRFMMNGILLSHGYPIINVPVKQQETFNKLMLAYYSNPNPEPMAHFLKSCLSPRVIEIMSE
jgi:Fic family protein